MSEIKATHRGSVANVNENQWNNVVVQSDLGTVFHRHEWIRAIENSFDYDARHVIAKKKGNPIAIMPSFVKELTLPDEVVNRLPTSVPIKEAISTRPGYGGPITLSDESESLDALFDAFEASVGPRVLQHLIQTYDTSYIRYGSYLEARGYDPLSDKCQFVIDLDENWETLYENMDKERRKSLRDANEQDARVEITGLGDEIDATYEAYRQNMDRVGGTVLPRAFLEELSRTFDDRFRVFTAVVDGEEVGRYVHLLDDEGSVLHHWLSAIPDTSCYEHYPSELLHERAIKWGIEREYQTYNFGVTSSHFSDSVFRFKKKYGGRVVPLLKWHWGQSRIALSLYKYGRSKYMQSLT